MTKNCIRCGVENPPAYRKERKFCSKPCYHAHYREQNRERIRTHGKKYQESEKGLAKAASWREENKEHLHAESQRRYQENREHRISQAALFAAENPGKVRAYKRTYAETERGKQKAHESRWARIARERGAEGSFTKPQFLSICDVVDWRCLSCLQHFDVLEADHVIALSAGGSNDISNIQPLCRSCNAVKGASYRDYRVEFLCQPVDLMEAA